MKSKLSALWILLAGCLWGSMGLFVRRFGSYRLDSMSIVFLRALFTAVLLIAVTAVYDRRLLKIKGKDLWLFAACGCVSIVFFNFCYFKAISLMSLSAAAILLYTSPIFVMLLAALFFKESITLKKIAAVAVSILGLVLVTGVLGDGSSLTAGGILCGLGAAVGYAFYSVFNRLCLNRGYHPVTITLWSFVFAAVFSLFLADIRQCHAMFTAAPSMLLYTALFAVVASILPYVLYAQGLKGIETGRAAVIASVEPVAAMLFGMAFFGEYPSASALLGILLVLAALALSQ